MATYMTDTMEPFAAYLTARGLADGTILRHLSAISGPTAGFLATVQKVKGPRATVGQVDNSCVDRHLAAHKGAAGSRSNKIESLRLYLRWAETRGLLRPGFTADRLLEGYKSVRTERRPKYYIPPEDFPALLAAAHNERDRAVIATGLYTLARQGEIAALTLANVDLNGNVIKFYREKRKRWTDTGLTPEFHAELTQWLKVYAAMEGYPDHESMMRAHPAWLLVPARHTWRGGAYRLQPDVQISSMERIVKMALTDLGVTSTESSSRTVKHKGEGMHTIRRSGARALFAHLIGQVGYDGALTFVQAMLDHENSQMTLRYIGMNYVKDQLNQWLSTHSMYGES